MSAQRPSIRGNEAIFDKASLTARKDRTIVYLTPPHAPSLVTTLSPNGTVNVGAFEQTMVCSYDPPVIILAISPKSDTLHNITDTGECVIGYPYPEYTQQVYDAGVRLPRGESELPYLEEVTTAPSEMVKPPRIEQCWFSAEGQLSWKQEGGDHIVLGIDIARVVFDKRYWDDDKIKRRTGLPALYYATSGHFFTPGKWTSLHQSERIKNLKHAD